MNTRLPKPHIVRSGTLWQCSSRHPVYPGCIAVGLELTPSLAYEAWCKQICTDITRFNLEIHPNKET